MEGQATSAAARACDGKFSGTTWVWMSMHGLSPSFMIGPTSFARYYEPCDGRSTHRLRLLHRRNHVNDRSPPPRPAAAGDAPERETLAGEHTSNHIVRSILGYLQERNLQPGDR